MVENGQHELGGADTMAGDVAPASGGDATLGAATAGPGRKGLGDLGRGAQVGRYMVLSRLGAGGMGVVYAAYDPELDRKVALKLVLPWGGVEPAQERIRLQREAQALARLAHPHVVTVHDVGTVDERVFLAMELVDGETLGAWMRRSAPSWAVILDVLVRAGRGLAAAHKKDLVHRDFKPDNVMVCIEAGGQVDRVLVMDFGLARTPQASEGTITLDETHPAPHARPFASDLTSGNLVGTPAYMAPEQFLGASTDARTDQFSFCVTLHEALFGQRPFAGETLAALSLAVTSGRITAASSRRGVPAWLRKIVMRGLAVDPEERWPTMDALLDAIERRRGRRRKGWIAAGVLAVPAVAGATASWSDLDEQRRISACEEEGARIEAVWNDGARRRISAGLESSGVAYAPEVAASIVPWLDETADAWTKARTEVCVDARVRGVVERDVLARARWCLDEARLELDALVTMLFLADADVAHNALESAASLPDPAACRDMERLRRGPAPPEPDDADRIRAARADLARARALERAGKYAPSLELAEVVREHAEASGWTPLAAAAEVQRGVMLSETGAYEEAERTLTGAYFEGRASDPSVAGRAALELAWVVGIERGRHDEGLLWARLAQAEATAAGDEAGLFEARRLMATAALRRELGEYEAAGELLERALSLREDLLGAEHPEVAATLNALATVRRNLGDVREAEALQVRALEIRRATLGPGHPDVAESLDALAITVRQMGDYARARTLAEQSLALREHALGAEHPDVGRSLVAIATTDLAEDEDAAALARLERALAIREAALGREHPSVAAILTNLAIAHRRLGRPEQAIEVLQRALAIEERSLGPDHPRVAGTLESLATAHAVREDYETAETLLRRALAIEEARLGSEHIELAATLGNLALVLQRRERHDQVERLYHRVLRIREHALGSDHPRVAQDALNFAAWLLEQDRAPEAIPLLERALKIHEARNDATEAATVAYALATALSEAKRDLPRAKALAERALAALTEDDPLRSSVESLLSELAVSSAGR